MRPLQPSEGVSREGSVFEYPDRPYPRLRGPKPRPKDTESVFWEFYLCPWGEARDPEMSDGGLWGPPKTQPSPEKPSEGLKRRQNGEEGRRTELYWNSGTPGGCGGTRDTYAWTPGQKRTPPINVFCARRKKFRTPKCRVVPVRTPEDPSLSGSSLRES